MIGFLIDIIVDYMYPTYAYGQRIPICDDDECIDELMLKHNQICKIEKQNIVSIRQNIKDLYINKKSRETYLYIELNNVKRHIYKLKNSFSFHSEDYQFKQEKLKALRVEYNFLIDKIHDKKEFYEIEFYNTLKEVE